MECQSFALGRDDVLQYYSALTTLWQRLDHLDDYIHICSTYTTAFQKIIDRQRIFKFLVGLRDEYDQVRCRIINIDQVPSFRKAFAIMQNEKSRWGVMLPLIPIHRDYGPVVDSDDKD